MNKLRKAFANLPVLRRNSVPGCRVITFTGGLGAQLISAAAYFYLQDRGEEVLADLSYFDREEKIAEDGIKGACTHWGWALDLYGIPRSRFVAIQTHGQKKGFEFIHDGKIKLELGLLGLTDRKIATLFPCPKIPVSFNPQLSQYVCLHMRRGDYLNVADYVVPAEFYIDIAKKFSGLLDECVVLSDSIVPPDVHQALMNLYPSVRILDQLDNISSHVLMRQARVLIGANSQFSLTAAALNDQGLTFVPTRWFSESGRELENVIHHHARFEFFSAGLAHE